MVLVKDKYGFLPVSVMEYENEPIKYKHLSKLLDIDLIKRPESNKYLPGLKFSKFSFGLSDFVIKYWSDEGDVVLDPFMGWGIRGVVSYEMNRSYIGYEILPQMFERSKNYFEKVCKTNRMFFEHKNFYKLCLNDGCILDETNDNSVDLIFTCPPYWDIEKYESIPGQLSDCKTYEDYLSKLHTALHNDFRVLKKNKFCIYVVADFRKDGFRLLHKDLMDIAQKNGFVVWDIVISVLRSPFVYSQISKCDKNKYTSKTHEYILVFKKV